jgi:elongation factor 1-beta
MAVVVITLKIMPENPGIDMVELEKKAKEKIIEFTNDDGEMKVEIEPVAFGLNALKIIFVMEESLGSPDPLAENIENFDEVTSAEIVDVRRALG